jgi:N-carbamoyl-L-amino-acid hydrolase
MEDLFISLRVNNDRLKTDFNTLAMIGSTSDGGVHRPALSDAHLAARTWFGKQIEAAGLELRIDEAGNHSAFLACGPPGAATMILGSHLDSVPNGGRYDGALGVLAALEALRVIRDVWESGATLQYHLEAIDFTDEEGTLVGLLGSNAIVGCLNPQDLENPRGGRDVLLAGFKRAGLTEEGLLNAGRDPASLAGYLELHIEQGSRLVSAEANIGVVTGIVGIGSYRLTFIGRADHAGTTSMKDRLDASQGASAFTIGARELVMDRFPDCVVNVGWVQFEPGAFNIVPARAILSFEYRAPEEDVFERLEKVLIERARVAAVDNNLELEIEFLGKHPPMPMSTDVQVAITQATGDLGLTSIPLASGAGHDAQSLARLCPAGMIFIPSVGGASHSPREYSNWQDCVNGANVLLQAALRFLT